MEESLSRGSVLLPMFIRWAKPATVGELKNSCNEISICRRSRI